MLNQDALANRLKFHAFRLAAALVLRSPASLCYAAAPWVGAAVAALSPAKRRAIGDNLRHALGSDLPDGARRRLTQAIFANVTTYYVDLFRTPLIDTLSLRKSGVQVQGLQHLRDATAGGHGAILATIHYGCPEIPLQAARAWRLKFFVLTEALQPRRLSDFYLRLRSSHGHTFAPVGLGAMKDAIRTLRAGGIVLLAVDRDIQGHGAQVPFFGAPAAIPTGAVELARRTGAAIVPVISHRLSDGSAVVTVQRQLDLVVSSHPARDTLDNTARLIHCFERQIRADPGQWLLLEPMWGREDHATIPLEFGPGGQC